MIEAAGLTKVHRGGKGQSDHRAVDNITFTARTGETLGLLGPNGAGKSSTMRMIACVSPPTSGSLRVAGMDTRSAGRQIRSRIGVVPQEDTLDRELSVMENLWIYGRYFGVSRPELRARAAGLLQFARLQDRATHRVDSLSGGMRRRLTIARALVNEPILMLLDEPTTGLDPQARHELWERLFELKERGVTLLLTTHYMDEAEQLCDRLVVMNNGRIVAEGAPRDLIAAHASREVVEVRFPAAMRDQAAAKIQRLNEAAPHRVEIVADRVLIYAHSGEEVLARIHADGLEPMTALVRRGSLEDVFLTLTGRSLTD